MPIEKVCEQCGQTFKVRPRDGAQKCCSMSCRIDYEISHGRRAAHKETVPFDCKSCGKKFTYKPSYLRAYQKKFGKDPMYCSRRCAGDGRHKETQEKAKFFCLQCGKENAIKRYVHQKTGRVTYRSRQKFCDQDCKVAYQIAEAGRRFEAGDYGKHIKRNGYVWITVPSAITGKKHAVMEHRHAMSRKLGRHLLKEETVHHINGDRQDNRLENLELFSSRHGPGQRVTDKVTFAIEILGLYPEFARSAGYELIRVQDG